jgi:hypothetical protein
VCACVRACARVRTQVREGQRDGVSREQERALTLTFASCVCVHSISLRAKAKIDLCSLSTACAASSLRVNGLRTTGSPIAKQLDQRTSLLCCPVVANHTCCCLSPARCTQRVSEFVPSRPCHATPHPTQPAETHTPIQPTQTSHTLTLQCSFPI